MKKFLLNFGINTFFVLGAINYIILLFNFILRFKKIIQQKKLIPIDNTFNRISLKFNNDRFFINIEKLNYLCQEKDTFGLIREIFFRNVYLKNLNLKNFNKFICFDLGCNRGIFSVIASKIFKFVICVDFQTKYNKCVDEIMSSNNQKNYEIINGIIGSLEFLEFKNKLGANQRIININELIKNKSNGEKIFLKIDIEGGEYRLFDEIDLNLVNIIVMEVHNDEDIQGPLKGKGSLKKILDKLNDNNFKFLCFDERLNKISYPDTNISFVRAIKSN